MTKRTALLTKALNIVVLAALALSVFPAGTALAATLPDDPQAERDRDYIPRLERWFDFQQGRSDRQSQLLGRISTFIERVQGLIDRASEKGYDTAAVQAALDDFSAAVPAAQVAHNEAGDLISAHTGFDDKGKVTNATAALQTIRDIRDTFRNFVDTLLPPYLNLRQSIRAFIDENGLRGKLGPTATAAP